jgi:hypothetical protein
VVPSVVEPSKVVLSDHMADDEARGHADSTEDQRARDEGDYERNDESAGFLRP